MSDCVHHNTILKTDNAAVQSKLNFWLNQWSVTDHTNAHTKPIQHDRQHNRQRDGGTMQHRKTLQQHKESLHGPAWHKLPTAAPWTHDLHDQAPHWQAVPQLAGLEVTSVFTVDPNHGHPFTAPLRAICRPVQPHSGAAWPVQAIIISPQNM